MKMQAISIQHVSKTYSIGQERDGSLRGTISSFFKPRYAKNESFWALKDVSFDVEKGDVVGIIGKNGAGKSTLLKILSQITKPTEGKIEINGRIASLLEVGTGFHPELTGRENIFLNGTILGMTRKEVQVKFDEIVAFSGIEKFIDTPVKHYSSGMYVRLAFAVAAHLEPEILIIDEVLAVGDAEFQKKCLGKMKDVAGEGRTVLFVSHQLGSVKMLCNKGVLIKKGEVKFVGKIDEAISRYLNSDTYTNYIKSSADKPCYVASAVIGDKRINFDFSQDIEFDISVKYNTERSNDDRILIRLIDEFETILTSFEKSLEKSSFLLTIPPNTLKKGAYKLNIILYQPAVIVYDNVDCCHFNIIANNASYAHLEEFNTGKIYAEELWLK